MPSTAANRVADVQRNDLEKRGIAYFVHDVWISRDQGTMIQKRRSFLSFGRRICRPAEQARDGLCVGNKTPGVGEPSHATHDLLFVMFNMRVCKMNKGINPSCMRSAWHRRAEQQSVRERGCR